jgi:putative methionine-R-sulfoxide reductase with GAF domain
MPANAPPSRDYDPMAARIEAARLRGQAREAVMQTVVDVLWEELADRGVSWVGFYTAAADGESLELGPHRDKPACTPIGLHGVCGQSFRSQRAMVIDDVQALGDDYVACDPRDRSEVVVPLFEADGWAWGVLDLDSHETGAFADPDVAGLRRVLAAAFGEAAVGVES